MTDTHTIDSTEFNRPEPSAATTDRRTGRFSLRDKVMGSPLVDSAPKRRASPVVLAGLIGVAGLMIYGATQAKVGTAASNRISDADANKTAHDAVRLNVADPAGNAMFGADGEVTPTTTVPCVPAIGTKDGAAATGFPAPATNGNAVAANATNCLPDTGQYVSGTQVPAIGANGQSIQAAQSVEQTRRIAVLNAPAMALIGTAANGQGIDDTGLSAPSDQHETPRHQPTEVEGHLQSATIERVTAGTLPNRNFLITAGTQIPCILQTAMDSAQPGFVTCVVPSSVFSDNGRVILLDKGTRVLGEYQAGIQQGQNRLFVVWTRAVTPRGISVALGSPAADALGRAGLGGQVETFFWKRFGGALLLSIVGDAGQAASNRLSGASQTSSAPSSAAAAAVSGDINIRPVVRASQGTEMTIFAARDFDFSNVYSLSLRP
jgi:type IV secretory pathway VirB10-like protein